VSTEIEYVVSGNEMEIRVPREWIGQVALDFHWADNIQADDDVMQFALNGAGAPNRRFNYRYQIAEPSETTMVSNGFETGDAFIIDWDIATAQAFSGSHALECSSDDDQRLVVYPSSSAGMDGIRISFKYKLQNVNSGILLYYNSGPGWEFVEDLGAAENDVWLQYTDVLLNSGADAHFFTNRLDLHIQGGSMTGADQFVWIDDFEVVGYTYPEPPPPASDESYAMWAGIFGMSTNRMADADGDGLNNFAEYAVGTDPLLSDVSSITEFSSSSMSYIYPRRCYAADLGLDYELAYKTSLTHADWLPLGHTVETGTNSVDAYFEAVTNEFPITGTDQAFIHLEIRGQ